MISGSLRSRDGGRVHLPIDETISIPDVEPFDCTKDFCCCKETKQEQFIKFKIVMCFLMIHSRKISIEYDCKASNQHLNQSLKDR